MLSCHIDWPSPLEKEKTLGLTHLDTILSVKDSARSLINVRKSAVAEDPLQRVLKSEEATLIEQNPGLLRQLMSSLTTMFVEQKKIEAAQTLRSRADALFLSKASTDEREALMRGFRLAHLFSRICSPRTPDGETLKQNWKAKLLSCGVPRRAVADSSNRSNR